MPQFNLTNHWIVFKYTTSSLQHVQKFQVDSDVVTPQASIVGVTLKQKDGTSIGFADFITDYTLAIAPFFDNTQSSFDEISLWYQPNGVEEPTFIAADTAGIIWTQPSGTGGNKQGSQTSATFRCADGRLLKLTYMEGISTPHIRQSLAAAPAPWPTWTAYILSNSCPILSRSGAVPILGMNRTVVYNDKIVRKRFNVD